MKLVSATALVLICCAFGCSSDQTVSSSPQNQPAGQSAPSGLAGSSAMGSPAAAGGDETPPPQNETTKQELADVAKAQKAKDEVQKQFEKNPNDPQLKQKYIAANDKYAYATMTCDAYTPHQKYSGALKIYRETLKVDPKDPDANNWVNMIVSIYKSMHRPVPNS